MQQPDDQGPSRNDFPQEDRYRQDVAATMSVGLVLRCNVAWITLMCGMGFEARRFDEDPDFVQVVRAL